MAGVGFCTCVIFRRNIICSRPECSQELRLSPYRIPLFPPTPLPLLNTPTHPRLVIWADPQSVSPQHQPQKRNVYCVYRIIIWFSWFTLPPHGVLPTYLHNPQRLTSSLSCNRLIVGALWGRRSCRHFGLVLAFLCAVAFVPSVKLLLGQKWSKVFTNKSSLNSIHTNYNH